MNSGQTFHIHLDIKFYLKYPDSQLEDLLSCSDTGRLLAPKEVRELFQVLLNDGVTCFSGCDNTKSDGSCAGHPISK